MKKIIDIDDELPEQDRAYINENSPEIIIWSQSEIFTELMCFICLNNYNKDPYKVYLKGGNYSAGQLLSDSSAENGELLRDKVYAPEWADFYIKSTKCSREDLFNLCVSELEYRPDAKIPKEEMAKHNKIVSIGEDFYEHVNNNFEPKITNSEHLVETSNFIENNNNNNNNNNPTLDINAEIPKEKIAHFVDISNAFSWGKSTMIGKFMDYVCIKLFGKDPYKVYLKGGNYSAGQLLSDSSAENGELLRDKVYAPEWADFYIKSTKCSGEDLFNLCVSELEYRPNAEIPEEEIAKHDNIVSIGATSSESDNCVIC